MTGNMTIAEWIALVILVATAMGVLIWWYMWCVRHHVFELRKAQADAWNGWAAASTLVVAGVTLLGSFVTADAHQQVTHKLEASINKISAATKAAEALLKAATAALPPPQQRNGLGDRGAAQGQGA